MVLANVGFQMFGASAVAVASIMFLLGFMPMSWIPAGVLHNEVIRRIFSADVQTALYPDNSFYNGTQQDANIAIDASEVEIPQDEEGEAQTVVNPTKFPLETYTEEDLKKTYSVDLIATKPQLVTDL
ncbi:MAG: hypothetical protein EAY68_11355, partial [Bacteroidetes bacterium]